MNFKDRYKQENEAIHPDVEFIGHLAGQMKKEQKKIRMRKRLMVSAGGLVAAAAVCILFINNKNVDLTSRQEQVEISHKAEAVETKEENQSHAFGQSAWYGEAETKEEYLTAFQTLWQEDTIKSLYQSEVEEWDAEDIISEQETEKIAALCQTAQATDQTPAGTPDYYMAVFEDGKIVKFQIYDDGYLMFHEVDAVYLLQK